MTPVNWRGIYTSRQFWRVDSKGRNPVMEKLIAQINSLGYAVQFYQWSDTVRWMTGDAQRWSAQANISCNSKGTGSMDEVCFGATAMEALGHVYIKCSAAAARKAKTPMAVDPFEFDLATEEDAFA